MQTASLGLGWSSLFLDFYLICDIKLVFLIFLILPLGLNPHGKTN